MGWNHQPDWISKSIASFVSILIGKNESWETPLFLGSWRWFLMNSQPKYPWWVNLIKWGGHDWGWDGWRWCFPTHELVYQLTYLESHMGRWWRLPVDFQEISNRDPPNVGPLLPANPPWKCWWKGGQTVKQQAIYFQGSVGKVRFSPFFFPRYLKGFQMLRVTVDSEVSVWDL